MKIEFKVGGIITIPLNITAEIVKVTYDYIILDVPDSEPRKIFIKDIGIFQELEK